MSSRRAVANLLFNSLMACITSRRAPRSYPLPFPFNNMPFDSKRIKAWSNVLYTRLQSSSPAFNVFHVIKNQTLWREFILKLEWPEENWGEQEHLTWRTDQKTWYDMIWCYGVLVGVHNMSVQVATSSITEVNDWNWNYRSTCACVRACVCVFAGMYCFDRFLISWPIPVVWPRIVQHKIYQSPFIAETISASGLQATWRMTPPKQ